MKFAVADRTGTIPAADLVAYAAAQGRQLREHYAACFDGDGETDTVRAALDGVLEDGEFGLLIEPTAPDQGELGVHDLAAGHAYKDLLDQTGQLWQVTLSHECLEARADRRLHACVELDDGTIWDREVCDRVEADSYLIDGVPLSNFNTPECFEPPPQIVPGVTKFDWMGLSSAPNEVRPGGYAQKYDSAAGWTQVGEARPYRKELAARGLSRGARRRGRFPVKRSPFD